MRDPEYKNRPLCRENYFPIYLRFIEDTNLYTIVERKKDWWLNFQAVVAFVRDVLKVKSTKTDIYYMCMPPKIFLYTFPHHIAVKMSKV